MPRSAPSPCRIPGCAKLSHSGFCEDHAREAELRKRQYQRRARERRRDDTTQHQLDRFYHKASWKACRKAYIAANPLCTQCEAYGRVVPGDVVDHIVERRDGGSDYNHSNLQTLCHGCHNEKTHKERRVRNGN